ncbi:MAG TPA: methyltransferase domain-containing protein [Chromatiaceae bacterium]|jgi:SAM-dependent methyltransferase|nr:methyltransferase domain-containing protein [Chromatiaceae bacterium]HIB84789.1 methyltransferase domain-containing protein [Chromatiaceae bacterium]HIN81819.1 methyltransferase domain-containing protein [Chromatiales bacterium]HIO15156.1 methyltransferase domain-containing protein [Chromatiales bacterium]HIO53978.1 methyltransferase domain-containing protein [Chromatiales bacterium]
MHNELAVWYRTVLGQYLREAEQAALEQALADLFGYHLLQLGCTDWASELHAASRIHRQTICHPQPRLGGGDEHLYCDFGALPIQTDSIDVLVLPHTLELEPHPHQILREIDRVLVPEGRVVIIGFNPYGLWGLCRVLFKRWGRAPWSGQFLGQTRVSDWLQLVGFDIEHSHRLFCRPPVQHEGLLRRLSFLDGPVNDWLSLFSASYILVAKKRISTLTPVKPSWRAQSQFVSGGVMEPSARTRSFRKT